MRRSSCWFAAAPRACVPISVFCREANHQLLHLAETDALTGLFNRRKIEYLLDDHLARCSRRPHPCRCS